MSCPEVAGDVSRVGLDAVAGEVLADALNVTAKDHLGRGVDVGGDRLGEVDDAHVALPVEDIVRGEVSMHDIVGEHKVEVFYERVEEWACLGAIEADVDERRCRVAYIAH